MTDWRPGLVVVEWGSIGTPRGLPTGNSGVRGLVIGVLSIGPTR